MRRVWRVCALSVTLALGVTAGLMLAQAPAAFAQPVWGTPTPLSGSPYDVDSVSCPASDFCLAVDGIGDTWEYNGSTWAAVPSAATGLASVSCVSSSFCMAVANGPSEAFTFNGTSWSAAQSLGGTSAPASVSCVSTTFCVAVDETGHAFTYTGSWAGPADIDPGQILTSVSCAGTTLCVAVDLSGNGVVYDGSWLSPAPVDGHALNAVSCPVTTACVAVDDHGGAVAYDGSSWSPVTSIDGTTDLTAISCPTTSFCEATDATGQALSFTGSWSAPQVIDSGHSLASVSCPSEAFCAAVDSNPGDAVIATGPTTPPPPPTPAHITWTDNISSSFAIIFTYYPATSTLTANIEFILCESVGGCAVQVLMSGSIVLGLPGHNTARRNVILASAHIYIPDHASARVVLHVNKIGRRILKPVSRTHQFRATIHASCLGGNTLSHKAIIR
jgi:hypothetical protein